MSGILPRCPGGHTMRVEISSALHGSGVTYTACCVCPCGWISPRISSTAPELARQAALELAGGATIPDDHLMDDAEARRWVQKFVCRV